METGAKQLMNNISVKLVFVTLGSKGCLYVHANGKGYVTGYKVKAVDTTGAGDAFVGAIVYSLAKFNHSLEWLTYEQIDGMVRFANAAAAICVTKRGAIPVMPTLAEVEAFMKSAQPFQ